MKPVWRKHLVICLFLGLLAVPIYFPPNGPAVDDIEKIFMKSPRQDDDGQFFYGVLPASTQPRK